MLINDMRYSALLFPELGRASVYRRLAVSNL